MNGFAVVQVNRLAARLAAIRRALGHRLAALDRLGLHGRPTRRHRADSGSADEVRREGARAEGGLVIAAPDIGVENHGAVVLLRPATAVGREWLKAHCDRAGYQAFTGGTVVCEPGFVADIVAAAHEAGLEARMLMRLPPELLPLIAALNVPAGFTGKIRVALHFHEGGARPATATVEENFPLVELQS